MSTLRERPTLIPPRRRERPATRQSATAIWLVGAVVLVVAASLVGRSLTANGVNILLNQPPIFADWSPHPGWGSLPAVAFAVAGWRLSHHNETLIWRRLLAWGWLVALGWTISLALVDGNWARILEGREEYLYDLPRITDPLVFLQTFTTHIVDGPDAWTTHVSAHPPLATLVFWTLAKVGLGGGFWAGLTCMIIGTASVPAWAVTLRSLGVERQARLVVPVLALFPGAVWVGVSADGMFAGVASVGVALACSGAVRRHVPTALAGGVLLGGLLYLSYGLILYGVVVLVVVVLSASAAGWRTVGTGWAAATVGVAVVVAAMTIAGFRWWEGLALLNVRYYQGIAATRPYTYFVWANLAAAVVCASPTIGPALGWSVAAVRRSAARAATLAPAWIALAATGAILLADLSGLSKAETERIWLPFLVPLSCALVLAPARWRAWYLIGGACWALAVNHLLTTGW